jgi:hypothetical protein
MFDRACNMSASLLVAALAVWLEADINALLIMAGIAFVIAVAAGIYEDAKP